MNHIQIPTGYVSADIISRNQINNVTTPQTIVNDVFDIPDFIPIPTASNTLVPAPAPAPTPAPVQPAITQSSIPIAVAPSTQNASNTTPINFIKAINHSAMTDVMNKTIARNIQQVTPSVGTKKTDMSIPNPNPNPNTNPNPNPQINLQSINKPTQQEIQVPQSPAPLLSTSQPSPAPVCSNKIAHRIKPTNTKIIIEEEDKDTAIDYDDEDTEIKRTKLSLFHFAKDITFNLIFTIPFLRTKLNNILREPTLAINQIERVFDEFKDRLNRVQLESLKKYVCEDGIRDKLNFILESGFNKILSDGKIDINDAPQFNQLVYFIIKSFNNINQGKVYRFYVSSEHVMLLLHFILKSVFTLTLKGEEEQMAIGLLDTSFKLVQIEVLPLISKRWYHRFRICHSVQEIEELIE
jgi:hypothetical protein